MKKILLVLPLFLLMAMPSFATTVTLNQSFTIADVGVYFNNPTTNYGNSTTMTAGNTGTNATQINRIFYKWNISSIPANATITDAQFGLPRWAMWTGGTHNVNISNTTNAWSESNLTYNNQPAKDKFQCNLTTPSTGSWGRNCSIVESVKTAYAGNKVLNLVAYDYNESQLDGWPNYWYTKEAGQPTYTANLTITYSINDCFNSCGNCGCNNDLTDCATPNITGSYCDMTDPTLRTIITTTSTCTNTISYCPVGDKCSQLTPQVNITSPLTDSASLCSACWFVERLSNLGGFSINCPTSAGFSAKCIWTNCPNNPECECSSVVCNSQMSGVENITTIPASTYDYTAGCYNPLTNSYDNVTLANGTVTSITNLSQSIFGNTTTLNQSQKYTNTTTTCYDEFGNLVPCSQTNDANLCIYATDSTDQTVCYIASIGGVKDIPTSKTMVSLLFTLLGGIAIVMLLSYAGVGGETIGASFLLSCVFLLVMFAMIGWFPSFLIVLLIVISSLLIAKVLKVF